jgi:hypothetical protein
LVKMMVRAPDDLSGNADVPHSVIFFQTEAREKRTEFGISHWFEGENCLPNSVGEAPVYDHP